MKTKTTWLALLITIPLGIFPAFTLFMAWLTSWSPASLPDAQWFAAHLPAAKATLCAAFIRAAPWLSVAFLVVPVVVLVAGLRLSARASRNVNVATIIIILVMNMTASQIMFWTGCAWNRNDHTQIKLWWF